MSNNFVNMCFHIDEVINFFPTFTDDVVSDDIAETVRLNQFSPICFNQIVY